MHKHWLISSACTPSTSSAYTSPSTECQARCTTATHHILSVLSSCTNSPCLQCIHTFNKHSVQVTITHRSLVVSSMHKHPLISSAYTPSTSSAYTSPSAECWATTLLVSSAYTRSTSSAYITHRSSVLSSMHHSSSPVLKHLQQVASTRHQYIVLSSMHKHSLVSSACTPSTGRFIHFTITHRSSAVSSMHNTPLLQCLRTFNK